MLNHARQIRLFERAATQRLSAAEFLMTRAGMEMDAVYLAGYGVECSLKALILRQTPRAQFKRMLRDLTEVGAKGHSFEYLKGILKEQHRGRGRSDEDVLGKLARELKNVASWSTDLRYQVGTLKPKTAHAFFEAATAIRRICARR